METSQSCDFYSPVMAAFPAPSCTETEDGEDGFGEVPLIVMPISAPWKNDDLSNSTDYLQGISMDFSLPCLITDISLVSLGRNLIVS